MKELTSKGAQGLIPNRNAEWIIKNYKFYAGDHWQGGTGWVGPRLDEKHEKYSATLAALRKIFLSKNMVSSVVDAHAQAVVGRSPHWNLQEQEQVEADQDEESDIQAEADKLLKSWLDSLAGIAYRDGDDTEIRPCSPFAALESATKFALLAKRGTLRFIISPKIIIADEETNSAIVAPMEPSELAKHIHIQSTNPVQATVHFDPKELEAIGVYTYEEETEEAAGSTSKSLMAELTYITETGNTALHIVNEDALDDDEGMNRTELNLGGNLLHYEFEIPMFISEQIQQAQMALNKAKTMASKNLDQGGFLERIFLNAQAPGEFVKDEKTGEETFVPHTLQIGPGYTTFLEGVETEKGDGSIAKASPSVAYRQPTEPKAFIDTAKDIEDDILMQVSQSHRGMEGNANTSGVSRVQARESFRQSLSKTEKEANSATKWMLETFLALIAALSGQPGRYAGLRVIGSAQLDIGVASSDEYEQNITSYDKKLQSRETTMAKLGIDDVLTEVQRIENDNLGGTSTDDDDDRKDQTPNSDGSE